MPHSAVNTKPLRKILEDIIVDFDAIENELERKHLKNLPTSFYLEPEDVDRLKDAAKKILTQSKEFQNLIKDLE